MSEQRSSEWYDEREGLFTSSRFNELMGIKGLGKTGESYCFDLACDTVMGREEDQYISYDMQYGIDTEPIAFEHASEIFKKDFMTLENCGFIKLNDYTGGSPDGMVNGKFPFEAKCPKRRTFLSIVDSGVIPSDWMDQVQHQIWVTDAPKGYFFPFMIYKGVGIGHLMEVARDQERIDLMKVRLKEAIPIREAKINSLKTKLKTWI